MPVTRKRLEALGVVSNPDRVNMNPLIGPSIGKAVFTTKSSSLPRCSRAPGGGEPSSGVHTTEDRGSFGSGGCSAGTVAPDELLESDIIVRRWSFPGRKGLDKLEPKFGALNVSTAFLIDGRTER